MSWRTPTLGLVIVSVLALSCGAKGDGNVTLSYQTDFAWLALTRDQPLKLTLYQAENGKLNKRNITVDIAQNASSVQGNITEKSHSETIHTLDIQFSSPISGSGVDLESLGIQLQLLSLKNTSKWELHSISLKYTGKLTANCSTDCELNSSNDIIVAPKPGYTHNEADKVCTKGYTICAPKSISWACSDQTLKPTVKADVKYVFGISLLGMRLQPFFGNGTFGPKQRFGYEWDCDPLLSIGIWQGLLVTLGFAMIVYWALSFLGSAHTPTRFDNPKDKPISVPLSE